tara:strand:+ start:1423 stop:1629 length:207 start_codon:yes stop_codon:yes gene_type:complete
MRLNLKTRKTKHVQFVQDYLFHLRYGLINDALKLDSLTGKKLDAKIDKIKTKSSNFKKYQKYLKLLML